MTTEDLLAFANLPDTPESRAYVEERRGLLVKMEQVCAWDRGEAPLPAGVLADTKSSVRRRKWWK